MNSKRVELWLVAQDKVLGEHIIKQARAQSRGDRVMYDDLIQEGILCALEGGALCKEQEQEQE